MSEAAAVSPAATAPMVNGKHNPKSEADAKPSDKPPLTVALAPVLAAAVSPTAASAKASGPQFKARSAGVKPESDLERRYREECGGKSVAHVFNLSLTAGEQVLGEPLRIANAHSAKTPSPFGGHELPRLSFHSALVLTVRALITEKPSDLERAAAALQAAETLSKAKVDGEAALDGVREAVSNFANAWSGGWLGHAATAPAARAPQHFVFDWNVVLAHCYVFRALLLFRTQSWLSGGMYLRSGWKQYESCLTLLRQRQHQQTSPSPYFAMSENDVLCCVGIFHFMLSIVPPTFRAVISTLGFDTASGDFEVGRNEVIASLTVHPNPMSPLARVALLWIESSFREDFASAQALYDGCVSAYGGCALLEYLCGYLHRRTGRVALALGNFVRARAAATELPELQLMTEYEIGWCHYLLSGWQPCVQYLSGFLARYHAPSFRAYAAYQLAYALELLNQPKRAANEMRAVPGWARKQFTFDRYAARKAAEYLYAQQLTPFQRAMVRAANQIDCSHYHDAHRILCAIAGPKATADALIAAAEASAEAKKLAAADNAAAAATAPAPATAAVVADSKSVVDQKTATPAATATATATAAVVAEPTAKSDAKADAKQQSANAPEGADAKAPKGLSPKDPIPADSLLGDSQKPCTPPPATEEAPAVALPGAADAEAEFAYLSGRVARGLGEPAVATEWFTRCIALGLRLATEKHLVPHAMLEIGELRLEQLQTLLTTSGLAPPPTPTPYLEMPTDAAASAATATTTKPTTATTEKGKQADAGVAAAASTDPQVVTQCLALVKRLEKHFERTTKANQNGVDFDVPLRRKLVLNGQRLKTIRAALERALKALKTDE